MCGRFYIPEDERVRMIRAILENTEYRDITVKAGDICPGDTAAVVACNKEMTPRPFAMEWGFRLSGRMSRRYTARSGSTVSNS